MQSYDEKGLKWLRTFLVLGSNLNEKKLPLPHHISKLILGNIGQAEMAEAIHRRKVAEELHNFMNWSWAYMNHIWPAENQSLKLSAQVVKEWNSSNNTQPYPDYNTHIQPLIKFLATLNCVGFGCQNFFYTACEGNYIGLAKELIALPNANLNQTASLLTSPLHVAAVNGFTEIIKLLLKVPNVPSLDINFCDEHGFSALMYATLHHQTDSVRLLLATPGVNLTLETKVIHRTALDIAENRGYNEIANLIREHIANAQNNQNPAQKLVLGYK